MADAHVGEIIRTQPVADVVDVAARSAEQSPEETLADELDLTKVVGELLIIAELDGGIEGGAAYREAVLPALRRRLADLPSQEKMTLGRALRQSGIHLINEAHIAETSTSLLLSYDFARSTTREVRYAYQGVRERPDSLVLPRNERLVSPENLPSVSFGVYEIPTFRANDIGEEGLPRTFLLAGELRPAIIAKYLGVVLSTGEWRDLELQSRIDALSDYQLCELLLLTAAVYRVMQHHPMYGPKKVISMTRQIIGYAEGKPDKHIGNFRSTTDTSDMGTSATSHVRSNRTKAITRLRPTVPILLDALQILEHDPAARLVTQRPGGRTSMFTPRALGLLDIAAHLPYDPEGGSTPYAGVSRRSRMNAGLVTELRINMVESFHDYLVSCATETVGQATEIARLHMLGSSDEAIANQLDVSGGQVGIALRSFADFITSGSFAAGLAAAVTNTDGLPAPAATPPRQTERAGSNAGSVPTTSRPEVQAQLLELAQAIIASSEVPLPLGDRPSQGDCRAHERIDMNVIGSGDEEAKKRCANCVARLRCLGVGLALQSSDGTPLMPPGVYGGRTAQEVLDLRNRVVLQSGETVVEWARKFVLLANRARS